MKKFLLTAIVVASFGVLAHGEIFHTPNGEAQSLATADYGGVYVSTSQFFVGMTTVTCNAYPCKGVWYGALFSTGAPSDFVNVFDATSAVNAVAQGPIARIYNIGASTVGITSIGGSGTGFSGPPKPVKFSKGLFWQASNANYNALGFLYYKEPDR